MILYRLFRRRDVTQYSTRTSYAKVFTSAKSSSALSLLFQGWRKVTWHVPWYLKVSRRFYSGHHRRVVYHGPCGDIFLLFLLWSDRAFFFHQGRTTRVALWGYTFLHSPRLHVMKKKTRYVPVLHKTSISVASAMQVFFKACKMEMKDPDLGLWRNWLQSYIIYYLCRISNVLKTCVNWFSPNSQRDRYLDKDCQKHYFSNVPAAVYHRPNDIITPLRCLAALIMKQQSFTVSDVHQLILQENGFEQWGTIRPCFVLPPDYFSHWHRFQQFLLEFAAWLFKHYP